MTCLPPPRTRTRSHALRTSLLPDGALLTGEEELARYSRDWSGDHFGTAAGGGAAARRSRKCQPLMRHCCHAERIRGRAAGRADRARRGRGGGAGGEIVVIAGAA